MDRLAKDQRYRGVRVFVVDFDSSKALLRQWNVRYQSTLIAFKGTTETFRSTAETSPEALRRVFEAAR